MEETKHNSDKQKCLGPYKLAKLLLDCQTEKEELASQVEELKVQLHRTKTHSTDHEELGKQLAAKVVDQNEEMESLRQQVKEMNTALESARGECDTLQQRLKHITGVMVRETVMRQHNQSMKKVLYTQMSRVISKLDKERRLKNKFMAAEKKAQKELHDILSMVKLAQDEYKKKNIDILKELEALKIEYEAEKDKNAALQQELEQIKVAHKIYLNSECMFEKEKNTNLQKRQKQENAEMLLAHLKLGLLGSIKDYTQQLKKQIQILQKNALDRERSFVKEVEDLISQAEKITSTNTTLTANDFEDNDMKKKESIHTLTEEAIIPDKSLPMTTKKHRTMKILSWLMGLTNSTRN